MIENRTQRAARGVRNEMHGSLWAVARSLLFSGAMLLALLPPAASLSFADEAAHAPADTVGLIEAHYRDLADLTATVVQKNHLTAIDKTQTFAGALSIKRPGRLRLEYTNGQVIVVNGQEAWFYSQKSEQAIRRTFRDFEQANIPVAFLLGAAEIRKEFAVTVPDAALPRQLDLAPRRTGAAMRKVRVLADDQGRIVQMTVFDRSGNTSEVSFTGIREGVGLADSLFRFQVPEGTEVIEQ